MSLGRLSRRSFWIKLCLSCFSRILWLMIQSVLTVEEERCQNKCYAASMILFLTVRPKNDYISARSFWHIFFDGIYHVIWHLEPLGEEELKKTPSIIWSRVSEPNFLLNLFISLDQNKTTKNLSFSIQILWGWKVVLPIQWDHFL